MLKCRSQFGGIIAARANTLLETSENGGNSIKSTFRTQCQSLDLPGVQKVIVGQSTFKIQDLKLGNLKLFIVANGGDIETVYKDIFRLIVETALMVCETIPGNLKKPCLMVLDEFQNIGSLRSLTTGISKLRGYGVRLVPMLQTLSGIQALYPENWRDFFANAAVSLWFGMGKSDTLGAEYLSSVLGQRTQEEKVGSNWVPWFLKWFFRSKQGRPMSQDRPLMTPGQVTKFLDKDHGNLIAVRYSKSPIKLKRVRYFKDLPVWNYSPSREHRQALLRRLTRWICSFIWQGKKTGNSIPQESTEHLETPPEITVLNP